MSYQKLIKECQQHQPDIHGYCGPASVITCLQGMGFDISTIQQSDLFKMARGKPGTEDCARWYSAPDLLVQVMNRAWAGVKPVEYCLAVSDEPGPLVLAMAAGIELHNAPSIALVQDGGHWISVVGYTANQAITQAVGDAAQVLDLASVNCGQPLHPELDAATAKTSPDICHKQKDQCGPTAQRPPLMKAPITDWDTKADWMDAAKEAGPWHNHRVAIVPKAVGGHLKAPFPAHFTGDIKRPLRGGGDDGAVPVPQKTISAEAAQKAVRKAVVKGELHARDPWKEHLGQGKVKAIPSPGQPVLVHHASRADEAYYVVPLMDSRVAARVNATTGAILDFGLFDRAFKPAGFTPRKATNAILKAAAAPGSALKRLNLTKVHPSLVWQHGKLSCSPYYPIIAFQHGQAWWGLNAGGQIQPLTGA